MYINGNHTATLNIIKIFKTHLYTHTHTHTLYQRRNHISVTSKLSHMSSMKPKSGRGGPSQAAAHPVYEDFRPAFERQREEEAEKLLVYLPGFPKENIRVSTEGKNTVRIRGEHLVGNVWSRFQEDFAAPDDCDMTKISARFENGLLTITMPSKKLAPHESKEPQKQKTPTTPPEETQPPPITSQNTGEGHGKPAVQQDSPLPKFTSPMQFELQEKDDNYEDKAKQKEKDEGEITSSSAWNYMEAIKSLTELPYEKRQLLMSAGAAVLVTVAALGAAYISLHYRETN